LERLPRLPPSSQQRGQVHEALPEHGVLRARTKYCLRACFTTRRSFSQQPTKMLVPPVLARKHRLGAKVAEISDMI
jgi:hypothetical protein